jgi:uncharacterized protein (DUF1778 family)
VAAEKLSISVDEDVAELVREAAAKEGITVSAWITNAAQDRLRNLLLGKFLDELLEEIGPMSEEEMNRLVAQSRAKSIHVRPNSGNQQAEAV